VSGLRADEARIPVYRQTTINQSGSYILTRDISVSSGVAILITTPATHVSLDLNGHTIQSSSGTSPVVYAYFVDSVQIRNGRLQGGNSGIQGNGASNLRIERVEITGTNDVALFVNPVRSIDLIGCHIHDVPGDAAFVANTTDPVNPTFVARAIDNTIERCGGNGLFFEGLRAGEVRHNSITDWGKAGFFTGLIIQPAAAGDSTCGGTLVAENVLSTVLATSGNGIAIFCPRNLVQENVVKGGGDAGIKLISDENRIERNVVGGVAGDGIEVGYSNDPRLAYRNHLEGNQVQGNSGASSCGIVFLNGNGHTFRNNIVRGNPWGICGGALGTNTDAGGNIL
jgi:hypothetical protein